MNYKKILTNKLNVIFLSIFASILWGSAFPVLKLSYLELNIKTQDIFAKIVFAGIRFLGASFIIFIALHYIFRLNIKIRKNDIKPLIILGILGTTLQYFFFYTGLAYTSGIKAAILSSIGNFFVVIMAHFYYKDDKITKGKSLGLIAGFLGIIIINWGTGFSFKFNILGEGFLILSALSSSLGTIYAKEISNRINPVIITFYQMLIGSIILLLIGLPFMKKDSIIFNFKGSLLLIYAAFLSAIAFTIWYSLLKYNKAGEITIYKFMIPVSGSILSIIFLKGEYFSMNIVFALILVVIGLVSINMRKLHNS